jgi:hypothetical protein
MTMLKFIVIVATRLSKSVSITELNFVLFKQVRHHNDNLER